MINLYVICSLLTTAAFLYLLYHYFAVSFNKNKFIQESVSEIEPFSDSIETILVPIESQINNKIQQHLTSSSTEASVKILLNKINKKQNKINDLNRIIKYLPNSDLGLTQMKIMNKLYKKNHQCNNISFLNKQKKKKNISNYVKKYGFYKTSLVTIYEQLQY